MSFLTLFMLYYLMSFDLGLSWAIPRGWFLLRGCCGGAAGILSAKALAPWSASILWRTAVSSLCM